MIRTIKFRYKIEGRKELMYDTDDEFGYLQRERKMIAGGSGEIFIVEDEMQFIGFKDKKKKDIYDKDIIQVGKFRFKIYHGQYGWCVQNEKGTVDDLDVSIILGEVIGNTYEKPNLIPLSHKERRR